MKSYYYLQTNFIKFLKNKGETKMTAQRVIGFGVLVLAFYLRNEGIEIAFWLLGIAGVTIMFYKGS